MTCSRLQRASAPGRVEYRVEQVRSHVRGGRSPSHTAALNKLGADGWVLCQVLPAGCSGMEEWVFMRADDEIPAHRRLLSPVG